MPNSRQAHQKYRLIGRLLSFMSDKYPSGRCMTGDRTLECLYSPGGKVDMKVQDILSTKLGQARRTLNELVQGYDGMDDTERLEKSNTILDEVNGYLKIQQNLVFPYIEKTGRYLDLMMRACDVYDEIDAIVGSVVMIHVDEPERRYYNCMVYLAQLLERAERVDREAIFPWMDTYLTDEEQEYIVRNVRTQMTHASISASGTTIY